MDRLSTIARLGAAATMLVAAVVVGGQSQATGAVAVPTDGAGHVDSSTAAAAATSGGKHRSGDTPKDGYLRAGALMSSCGNMEMG